MTSKPFDETPHAEWSSHSERECGKTVSEIVVRADMAAARQKAAASLYTEHLDEVAAALEKVNLAGEMAKLKWSDAHEEQVFIGIDLGMGPDSTVRAVWNGHEWQHETLTPHGNWKAHGEWLASLKPGDKVKLCKGDVMLVDPTMRGHDALYEYRAQGGSSLVVPPLYDGECVVSWLSSVGNTMGVRHYARCHMSQLVKP